MEKLIVMCLALWLVACGSAVGREAQTLGQESGGSLVAEAGASGLGGEVGVEAGGTSSAAGGTTAASGGAASTGGQVSTGGVVQATGGAPATGGQSACASPRTMPSAECAKKFDASMLLTFGGDSCNTEQQLVSWPAFPGWDTEDVYVCEVTTAPPYWSQATRVWKVVGPYEGATAWFGASCTAGAASGLWRLEPVSLAAVDYSEEVCDG